MNILYAWHAKLGLLTWFRSKLTGWDIDEFPNDIYEATLVMYEFWRMVACQQVVWILIQSQYRRSF